MIHYYIKTKGEVKGPFAESQLHSMWNSGAITSDTLFRESNSQNWLPITELFETEEADGKSNEAAIKSNVISPKRSQKLTIAALIVLVLIIVAIFFGNIHIITGSNLGSPRIVRKESFGFSETFINIDTITHMPWIAAKSRYPLSCAVLQREGLIESDEEFKERTDKELQTEIQNQFQNLTNN